AQLLTESLALGTLGAAAGVGLAVLLVRALALLGPPSIPRLASLAVDVNVLAFALGTAVVTSAAFGLAPVVLVSGGLARRSFSLTRPAAGRTRTARRPALA